MQIAERSWNSSNGDYRFGFNGKENDNEVKGVGNSIAFEARIYDSRLGRFLSRDPLEAKYVWQSTYVFAHNSPVVLIDYKGMGDPPYQVPANEIFDIDKVPVDFGRLSEWYYMSRIDGHYAEIYQFETGKNAGNYAVKVIYGKHNGITYYKWQYVIGEDRVDEYVYLHKNDAHNSQIPSTVDLGLKGTEYAWSGGTYWWLASGLAMGGGRYGSLDDFDASSYLRDQWTDPAKVIGAISGSTKQVYNKRCWSEAPPSKHQWKNNRVRLGCGFVIS